MFLIEKGIKNPVKQKNEESNKNKSIFKLGK